MRRIDMMIKAAMVLIALLVVCSFGRAWALTVEANPEKIPITIGYHGTTITIRGKGLNAPDIIIQIHSKLGEEHLKYKGKAGGIFWMKLGNIVFEDVPKVYLVYSTRDMHNILPQEACRQLSIGYDALRDKVRIKTKMKDLDRDKWILEFLKFMEEDQLYDEEDGVVHIDKENHTFSIEVNWPFEAPPGDYQVQAFAVENGQVIDKAQTSIKVERVGLIRQLTHMAFEKPALYGIIALVVAIVAGFGVGMVFKGGGSH